MNLKESPSSLSIDVEYGEPHHETYCTCKHIQTNNLSEISNSQKENYSADTQIQNESQIREKAKEGYETREASSNNIYLVQEETLTYRGKKYSYRDIATKWKKDCRMWLWKNRKLHKHKFVGELNDKLKKLNIHNT